MHIGLDDTDSTRKGCTTYVTALLVEKLEKLGVTFLDYPSLVRLNPNVPWKTRGNGALCLRIEHAVGLEDEIKDTVVDLVEECSDLDFCGTDPGVVFFGGAEVPEGFKVFSRSAVTGVVTLEEAVGLVRRFGGEAFGFKGCRGVIGALAAVGETFGGDYTFELIAYRVPENYGLRRRVDVGSVFGMDELTRPWTFNNVDLEKGRVIITPRGPDPILFGIRGESAGVVRRAFGLVKPLEGVERWVVFRSNQGTDAHLLRVGALSEVVPFGSVVVGGVVSCGPRVVRLRHVVFSLSDGVGEVDCVAFEPTGVLRGVARELVVGDRVEVCGAVRAGCGGRGLTVNLEKIRVLELARKVVLRNPVCSVCGKRLESMGVDKGFRCKRCGRRFVDAKKVEVEVERGLKVGLYVTSVRSQRHLTKPLSRYGLEKHGEPVEGLIEDWHSP